MKTIYILNIPNFYCSYYLYGFYKNYKVVFRKENQFLRYNNRPILIFKIDNKIGVINNDDPSYFDQNLYELADASFFTNKLLNSTPFQQNKVKPLFPHYPINILPLYIKLFHVNLIKLLKIKSLLKEVYILTKRPIYKKYGLNIVKDNYVFFSSSLWKKEKEANTIRANFIRYCLNNPEINFEGGFVKRSDNNNFDFEEAIFNAKTYTPKMFSRLSKKSKIVLNNPAVCGAVSWRLAEYLNQGLFIISLPFKVQMPINFVHNENLYFFENNDNYKNVFDLVLNNPSYHENISKNAKSYFDTYCTPQAQATYIINTMLN